LSAIGMFCTLECLCGVVDDMENLWCASGCDGMRESRWVLLNSPRRAGWSPKRKALT